MFIYMFTYMFIFSSMIDQKPTQSNKLNCLLQFTAHQEDAWNCAGYDHPRGKQLRFAPYNRVSESYKVFKLESF